MDFVKMEGMQVAVYVGMKGVEKERQDASRYEVMFLFQIPASTITCGLGLLHVLRYYKKLLFACYKSSHI